MSAKGISKKKPISAMQLAGLSKTTSYESLAESNINKEGEKIVPKTETNPETEDQETLSDQQETGKNSEKQAEIIPGETLRDMLLRLGEKEQADKLVSNQMPSKVYDKIKVVADTCGVTIQTAAIAMVNYFIASNLDELKKEHRKKSKSFL